MAFADEYIVESLIAPQWIRSYLSPYFANVTTTCPRKCFKYNSHILIECSFDYVYVPVCCTVRRPSWKIKNWILIWTSCESGVIYRPDHSGLKLAERGAPAERVCVLFPRFVPEAEFSFLNVVVLLFYNLDERQSPSEHFNASLWEPPDIASICLNDSPILLRALRQNHRQVPT